MDKSGPGSSKPKKKDHASKANEKPKDKPHKTDKKEKHKKPKNNKEHKKEKKEKKRKHDENVLAKEGDVSEDELPPRDDASEGGEEADLWNSIGTVMDTAPEERKLDVTVGGTPEPQGKQPPTPVEDHVIQVPADIMDRVADKLPAVGNMVKTAMLVMKGSTVHISGPLEAKLRASQGLAAVLDNRVAEGVPDVTTVHVLPEWVDTWDGCKALEDELQVLIVFERLRGQSAFSHGHLAGLPYKQMNSEGQEFEKYQPVIVKKISPGGTRVQVTWCFDGLLKDEDSSKLQAAVRVSIMGTQQSRAKAVLRILMSADQGAQGLLASQLEALEKAGDVFGCDGGPGSYGLQKFDMMVDTPHVRKFMRQGEWPDAAGEGHELLDRVKQVSKCSILWVYQRTVGVTTSYQSTTQQLLVAVGSRTQRWIAAELLRMMIVSLGAVRTGTCLGALPSKLAEDCTLLVVPQQALPKFFGKLRTNYKKLMEDTNTIVIPIRDLKGSEKGKAYVGEVDNFMETMYKAAADDGTEFAIFGSPLGQKVAMVKTLIEIERTVPGYAIRTFPPEEKVDESKYTGLDRVRLSYDFQEDASNKKAEILSSASGCHVECSNDLLLLVGGRKERARARDYARLMAGKTFGKNQNQFPSLENAETRPDILGIWVSDAASKSRWFKDKLKILMADSGLCAFFLDSMNESAERRLCFAGRKLEENCHDVENNDAIAQTLEKTRVAVDFVLGKDRSGSSEAWWSEWSWQRKRQSKESTQDEPNEKMAKTDAKPAEEKYWQREPPKMQEFDNWKSWNWNDQNTDAAAHDGTRETTSWTDENSSWQSGDADWSAWEGWSSWEWSKEKDRNAQPSTPASFGPHGNSAPQTPAPLMHHAAPQTPASFGPHGSAAPQTPLPISAGTKTLGCPANSVPGPATPAFHNGHVANTPRSNVPEPATPAFQKSSQTPHAAPNSTRSVSGPVTPAVRKSHVPEPATPAFHKGHASTIPHSTVPEPNTPAQAARSVAEPHTPAFRKGPTSNTPRSTVPEPATPAFPKSHTSNAPHSRVPEPATPACPKAAKAPPANALAAPDQALRLQVSANVPGPATPAAPQSAPVGSALASGVRPGPITPAMLRAPPANAATSAATGGASGQTSDEPELPPGWQKCISKKYGKAYYFNAQLKKSQYERPS